MKRTIALLSIIALAASCACTSSGPSKRGGGLNLGKQMAQITLTSGSNNDVAIPGGSPTGVLRFLVNASGSTLSGLVSSYWQDGDVFVLRNDSTAGNLTITNADTASVLANRFLTPNASALVIPPKGGVLVEWDATVSSYVITLATPINTTPVETVTAGALSVTQRTNLSVTGTQAYTLADGTAPGQTKIIECTVASTTPLGTLTITTPFTGESSTHVFTAVGQRLVLEWQTLGWHTTGKTRAGSFAVVVGTTVLTGYDMALTYALSVTATVASTTTKGIPNGIVPGEIIHLTTPTAASTPSGSISITATTVATGAAATSYAGINATSCEASFWWDGAAWQNIKLTTATLSMIEDFLKSSLIAMNDNVPMLDRLAA